MDLPEEYFQDAIDMLGTAMEAEDAEVRTEAARIVTKYRAYGAVPAELVSQAELILEVRREGFDDRTGKHL